MANDSELRSLMLDSKSEASMGPPIRQRWINPELHERFTLQDMEVVKEAFSECYKGKMFPESFRCLLRDQLNIEYDDEEFKILFLKINSDRDGALSWDELVSHMMLGFFNNDPENQRQTLEPPIMGLPRVLRSMHRNPVSRVCFCPDVTKDRSTDPLQGSYITGSRDGTINWWTLGMNYLRGAQSSSPQLKVRSTWVTDMVSMPDVNIIATSSTERDLRFYDCTAGTFTLKIVITSWEYMICTMHYYFPQDMKQQCALVCGDVGGNVRVLQFSPVGRGPFQSQAAKTMTMLRHVDLVKRPRLLPALKLTEFPKVHSDWVRQVSYYPSLHCFVSCSTCPDSLLLCDLAGSKTYYMFHVDKGVQCFAFDEDSHTLVTGGPDCCVRVWNTFVTSRANVTFVGHRAGITAIVLQKHGQLVYSLSRDRTIKVWDVAAQECIQTYIDIPSEVGERTPITSVYNPATRDFLLAAIRIAIITLDEQLNPLHTDGFTHSRAVTAVLYNPLFKVIITCGMDSIIINWNPLTGKRNMMVREAHSLLVYGQLVPMEITAACFDDSYLQLLTGARDGSLKIWNFNTGACMRILQIERLSEVTGVFWFDGRIMVVGWNMYVTEFDEAGTSKRGKAWEKRHEEEVTAIAARAPYTMATCSYSSELILWKLETGQPFRRFSCTEPEKRIKIGYSKHGPRNAPTAGAQAHARPGAGFMRRAVEKTSIDMAAAVAKANARRDAPPRPPPPPRPPRPLAIHAAIFLSTRPQDMHVASLMVGLEDGQVQAWSDHPAGGIKGSFLGVHAAGDYVAAFATDLNNDYLFSGTTNGYVKVWLMTNYCRNEEVHVNMPKLRLEFPFLWRDRIEGRAKRFVRAQPLPLLLNSYRAHLRRINALVYIDENKLLLTGSSDYSVRLWRLSGEYLQTLGGLPAWTLEKTRYPPDVRKVASSTTLKVWNGGWQSRFVPGKKPPEPKPLRPEEIAAGTYGKPVTPPVLGHYTQLPRRPERCAPITLDDSLPVIPVYAHVRMPATCAVRRPPTPPLIRDTRLKRTPQPRRSTVRQSMARPSMAPPSMARPSIARPSMARPSMARPSMARPSKSKSN